MRVIIVGAGPAGVIAAISLARANCHVTLIEQSTFPRDKVCGESLSATGIQVLHDLSLTHLFPDAVRITRTALHTTAGQSLSIHLPRPMWGISRKALDTRLLQAAREAGALILQPARCEKLTSNPTPRVTVRHLQNNHQQTIDADWLIVADGKSALLPHRPRPTADMGIKTHFKNVRGPTDAVELFGLNGHYVGVAPIEPTQDTQDSALSTQHCSYNIAFSLPTHLLEPFRGNLTALWHALLKQNPLLAERFQNAQQTSDWQASPLPRFPVIQHWPPNTIPVGNAAAALEPIGGEGMGLAMRSAQLAATHLVTAQTPDPAHLKKQFQQLWQTRRTACRALAQLLSRPTLSSHAMDLALSNHKIPQAVLALMGK